MGTLKPHSNRPLYSSIVTGTLAVDGWAVTGRRGLGGAAAHLGHSSLYQIHRNSPPINSQCTNFIQFDVALWLLCTLKGYTIMPHSVRKAYLVLYIRVQSRLWILCSVYGMHVKCVASW